jgi:hypothetical protein
MAQQTAYNNNPAAALAGLVRWTEGTRVISKVAEGSVPIGLLGGVGAQSESTPAATVSTAASGQAGTIKALPASLSGDPILESDFIGIPILDTARGAGSSDQIGSGNTGTFFYSQYNDKIDVPVLRKGEIWVFAQEAPTQYGDVYVYTTAQTNIPRGAFGFGAGTGKVKFGRGRWLMTLSAAGLALMEVW